MSAIQYPIPTQNMVIYVKIKYVCVNLCLLPNRFIQRQIILPTKIVKNNEVHEAEFREKVTFSQINRKFTAFSYGGIWMQYSNQCDTCLF